MSIINRYISREILKVFLAMLGVLVAIFIGFTAAVQLKQAAAGVIAGAAVPQLILLNTLIALEILLPSTLFFGSIAALGRMQNDFEILTIYSAGTTPARLAFTVAKIGLVVAVVAAFLSIFARPWAYKLSYQLESEAKTKLDVDTLTPRQFVEFASGDYVLYAQAVDRENGYFEKVFLQRKVGHENPMVISAQQARLLPLDLFSAPALQFNDGYVYRLDPDGERDVVLDFDHLRVQLPEEEKLSKYRRNAMPTATLALSERAKDIAEYQWRLVMPVLILLIAVLAVPLSTSRPGQSRTGSIVVALVVFIVVFGVGSVIRTAIEQERIGTMPGMWLVPMFTVLLLVTISLVIRFKDRFLFRQ